MLYLPDHSLKQYRTRISKLGFHSMPLTVGLYVKHKAITASPTDYLLSTLEGMIVARHIGHDGTLIRLGRVDQI